ncbi:hypothetical protein [Corynebacterium sphenisci]|uniref:hypothetical protein n=1 Tax=Corynebacterium sphenisci TaxID=191493 RepID=UPI0026E0FC56|nr:hypothetical protein [Corynebacterium sphenisci]MDO5732023.1 hypothetical protein [Corynebacterium sphenisci]
MLDRRLEIVREAPHRRHGGGHPPAGMDRGLAVLDEHGISHAGRQRGEIVARTVHRADRVMRLGVDGIPDVPGARYARWAIADPGPGSDRAARHRRGDRDPGAGSGGGSRRARRRPSRPGAAAPV